jgi:hypothetical protein
MVAWPAPSRSASGDGRSGRCRRIESIDQLGEVFDHGGVVVVGMVADEVNHLTIAVGRLSAVAARLVHHSEAVPAIMDVGKAQEQVACSRLGLVELGGANQVHYGIGGGIKRVLVSIFLLGPGEAGGDRRFELRDLQAIRRGVLVLP